MNKILSKAAHWVFGALVLCSAACSQMPPAGETHSGLQIDSLTKVSEATPGSPEAEACEAWTLTKNDVAQAFAKMRRAESVDWNGLCYDLPCYYSGRAKYQGREYNMKINAASYISLYEDGKGKEGIFFILEKETPYFLMPCDCCED